ncbi:hypothetical protein Naga_101697g1, partial [Nannochloropsis gaditana]
MRKEEERTAPSNWLPRTGRRQKSHDARKGGKKQEARREGKKEREGRERARKRKGCRMREKTHNTSSHVLASVLGDKEKQRGREGGREGGCRRGSRKGSDGPSLSDAVQSVEPCPIHSSWKREERERFRIALDSGAIQGDAEKGRESRARAWLKLPTVFHFFLCSLFSCKAFAPSIPSVHPHPIPHAPALFPALLPARLPALPPVIDERSQGLHPSRLTLPHPGCPRAVGGHDHVGKLVEGEAGGRHVRLM